MAIDDDPPPPPLPPPPTLSRAPSYLQFGPRRAMASFENLVALANYEEHLREARRMVWRDRGQPAVELHDLAECADHGVRGGFRAGAIAFTIRSGVSLVLLLVRIRAVKREHWLALVRRALFGEDSFRAGAMLACFVGLYRTLLNALPILFPTNIPLRARFRQLLDAALAGVPSAPIHATEAVLDDDDDDDSDDNTAADGSAALLRPPSKTERAREARLSVSAQAHQTWVRKRTRRWHALLAGAVAGGCAVLCEKRTRRVVIAQQVFVRGLQGSWNALSDRQRIRVPFGDVLVFSLACAQIMYGYLVRPDTLPRAYIRWIDTASRLPPATVAMNRDLSVRGTFDVRDLETVLETPYIAPANASALAALHTLASSTPPIWGHPNAPCVAAHPGIEHCLNVPADRFTSVFRWMFPIYGALHLVPTLLFKPRVVAHAPARTLARAAWGTARSSAFLGAFVVIYQGFFCAKVNGARHLTALAAHTPPEWARAVRALLGVVHALPTYYLGGFFAGLALLIEAPRRRPELAMYVLPRALESAWTMAVGRRFSGALRKRGAGEALLTAVGMGMLMSAYQNEPEHLSGLVRRVLYQFIGPN